MTAPLAVHSFKLRISDYWSAWKVIIPIVVTIKGFKDLLRMYEFELQVQAKKFIIEVLSLRFRDVFRFSQYSSIYYILLFHTIFQFYRIFQLSQLQLSCSSSVRDSLRKYFAISLIRYFYNNCV